jgi:hypothetical protein
VLGSSLREGAAAGYTVFCYGLIGQYKFLLNLDCTRLRMSILNPSPLLSSCTVLSFHRSLALSVAYSYTHTHTITFSLVPFHLA